MHSVVTRCRATLEALPPLGNLLFFKLREALLCWLILCHSSGELKVLWGVGSGGYNGLPLALSGGAGSGGCVLTLGSRERSPSSRGAGGLGVPSPPVCVREEGRMLDSFS